ncbi:hypothetical protein BOX15_Mlig022818g3 [Macrostomum lignano]|uniref:Uncharacterized protein n=1 Tax=Macrostomum lignano TaxID=282301 RepID=A0A267DVN7_9PLAT|nr:hypothetical protein BOX15_Mlig022818g3 [Macrostomum lignano]
MAAVAAAEQAAAPHRAVEQLDRERRKREKLKTQAARQQSRIQELEESLAASTAAASAAQEAAERHRGQAELLRRRHEAEAARRDEELRELQARHSEEDSAAREALTKVSLSLEAARLEAAGLRQALSREQLEANERRAEAERLRASLAEAAAASAESERAIDELTGEKRDGAGRLRELREANIRLQEKLAGAESRLAGLRDDCQAAAALAEERGRLAEQLREQLATCEAGHAVAPEASPPGERETQRPSAEQLAEICQRLERAEAAGWSLKAAAAPSSAGPPQSPPTPSSKCPEKPDGESQSAAATTATLRERRRAEAAEAALASARSELATTQAELAKVRTELAEASGRLSESGVGDLDDTGGDSRRRRYSVAAAEDARKLPDEADEDIEVHRENPEGRSGWRPGLWRTSYCSNDLEGLRRACLSLAAERDRLSGDCRHYRRLYEEERRLRRRLTDEVRRLNCTDGRGRALRMMAADPPAAFDRWTSPKIPGDPEMASFSTYLRSKYSVT